MPNPNPNTKGLFKDQAPDAFELTEPVTGRIEKSNSEWLRQLPGGISFHLRQAVKLYRESIEESSRNTGL
jgi:hypothetical protein